MQFPIRTRYSPFVTAPPTRDEILKVNLTFQGLTVQFQDIPNLPNPTPGFEACIPWLTARDRQNYYNAKRATGRDSHCILTLPDGAPLYNEWDNPYNPNNFPTLDWTSGNTKLGPEFANLLTEYLENGWNKVLLYLGGDGSDGYPIAMQQLELLKNDNDYNSWGYKYCVAIPGWDSVFYGWEPSGEKIPAFFNKYREYWSTGYTGLHHGTGHIPIGEGGDDYKPGGRLKNLDLVLSEYDLQLHQDTCWQINGRLVRGYRRPTDQTPGDDPNPPFYLVDSERGPRQHCGLESGEWEWVRGRCTLEQLNNNRRYLNDMNDVYTG